MPLSPLGPGGRNKDASVWNFCWSPSAAIRCCDFLILFGVLQKLQQTKEAEDDDQARRHYPSNKSTKKSLFLYTKSKQKNPSTLTILLRHPPDEEEEEQLRWKCTLNRNQGALPAHGLCKIGPWMWWFTAWIFSCALCLHPRIRSDTKRMQHVVWNNKGRPHRRFASNQQWMRLRKFWTVQWKESLFAIAGGTDHSFEMKKNSGRTE